VPDFILVECPARLIGIRLDLIDGKGRASAGGVFVPVSEE
jgi:hypothetical protein